MRAPATALALFAAAAAGPAFAADPTPVVAAERAFAADGLALGIRDSFLKHATAEAIVFAPDPVRAHAFYGARPSTKGPPLVWWPLWAGISRSGDLGFTTGPATYDGKPSGWYFTVWARQADGSWKWVYDGGAPSAHGEAPGAEAEPAHLAPATGPDQTPEAALNQVRALETQVAVQALDDARGALKAVLAPEARVVGSPAVPATTPQAVEAELSIRPAAIAFSALGGGASDAGDLVWTYGDARWEGGRGHYVRLWRHDLQGWRLVYDMILTVPPPKA
jgi:hypothetical protein